MYAVTHIGELTYTYALFYTRPSSREDEVIFVEHSPALHTSSVTIPAARRV